MKAFDRPQRVASSLASAAHYRICSMAGLNSSGYSLSVFAREFSHLCVSFPRYQWCHCCSGSLYEPEQGLSIHVGCGGICVCQVTSFHSTTLYDRGQGVRFSCGVMLRSL